MKKQSNEQVLNQEHLNESTMTTKSQKRSRELDNLNKNLMKKVYTDLYIRNIELYQEKDLTFENFVFHFYLDFEKQLDFENPDYNLLLERMDLIVKSKFNRENKLTSDKNKRELTQELNLLCQGDEWGLINRYRNALYLEEEEKNKKLKGKKKVKYFNELDNQINSKKNYVDPIWKKKNEVYLFDEKENIKNLENQKIQNQDKLISLRKNNKNPKCITTNYLNYLEKENFNINNNNKDLITYKIDKLMEINDEKFLDDKLLPLTIEQIIYEKDLDKIKKGLKQLDYQKDLISQMDYVIRHTERPCKMSVEERKINKDLLEAAKNYFKQKYKLAA